MEHSLLLLEQIGFIAGEGLLSWDSTVSVKGQLRIGPQLREIIFPLRKFHRPDYPQNNVS